jgi:hypothetical protein
LTELTIAANGTKLCEVAAFKKLPPHLLPAVDLCFGA